MGFRFTNPKRQAQKEVLEAAAKLDPNDHSPRAEQLRETAEDIQDHLESEAWNTDPEAN